MDGVKNRGNWSTDCFWINSPKGLFLILCGKIADDFL